MLVDSLRPLLLCPICTCLLSSPSTLSCGHSICGHHPQRCPYAHPSLQTRSTAPSSKVPVVPPPTSFRAAPPIPTEHKPDVVLNNIVAFVEDDSDSQVDEAALEKALLNELNCVVCFVLLYEPITTPCQHTFCTRCLHRSLDHNNACPVCRKDLPSLASIQEFQPNRVILSIIQNVFPMQYRDRTSSMEAEIRDARLDTPIFIPPHVTALSRITFPCFGMVMPAKPGSPPVDYGTMLEIRSVQMLPDGRSIVETWGIHRFRIMERSNLDGYIVGRVERIDDYQDDIFDPLQVSPTNVELMQRCRRFLDRLRRGTAPWVVQRLNNTYGPMPDDASAFSFWVALVLPIDEYEKAKLLAIQSVRLRLLLVTQWIGQLDKNWYAFGYLLGGWWDRGATMVSGMIAYILLLIGWL